jgi:hypothetical protein
MKKITTFILILFTFSAFAQTPPTAESLKKEIDKYCKLSLAKDIDGLLDYMPYELFEVAPRDMMKNALEQSFNNEKLDLFFDKMEVTGISPITEKDKKYYARIDYSSVIRFGFTKMLAEMDDDAKKKFIENVDVAYKKQFGEKNIKFNAMTNTYTVSVINHSFAIYNSDWKFIGDEAQTKMLVDKIVPEEVQKKLKN